MKPIFTGFFALKNIDECNKKNAVFLYGIPFERVKATKGGSKKGPKAIRRQSVEFSGVSTLFNASRSESDYFDLGDIHPLKEKNKINQVWEKIYELNAKLIVLGGDHSITLDTLSKADYDDKTAVIWLDAHADLADEYPEGVFQSHGTVFTNLKTKKNLKSDQMLLIGGHAYTQTLREYEIIQSKEVTYLSAQQLLTNTKEGLKFIEEYISKFERIYLSIDLDVLDQAYVPTLATSEPFGLTPQLVLEILSLILPKAQYVDIVEARFTRSNKIVLDLAVGFVYYILEQWEEIK